MYELQDAAYVLYGDRCSHMVLGLICHESTWSFYRAITSPIHVNVGQQKQPGPPWVLSAGQDHQPCPVQATPLAHRTSQRRGANLPCTVRSFFMNYTSCIFVTDKAIRRLQIQQSPGQKTTAAGEPPSTSANAFAACTGRHPTAPLSAQGKHALTPCQPPKTGLPKQALASHRLHGSPRHSLPTMPQNSLG